MGSGVEDREIEVRGEDLLRGSSSSRSYSTDGGVMLDANECVSRGDEGAEET